MRSASSEERDQDRAEFDRFRATHKTFAVQTTKDLDALFEATEKATTTPTAQPKGEKTIARIARIEEVLKTRGPSTLKELERILGIDKATMTRLLGKLDMRRYELHSRPGDDREKVLRLKVQIR
jgi:Fic family protein